jgi:apolipoprotein N-acyltransferase
MYATLRTLRALAGVFFVWQLIGLLPVLTWLQNPSAVTAGMWAAVIAKLVMAAIGIGAFVGLKKLINFLHVKNHGVPHPAFQGKNYDPEAHRPQIGKL